MADLAGKREHHPDWHQTSSGVGHHYRPGYYFPDSTFQSVLRDPLPPNIAKQEEIPNDEAYPTTTQTVHDHKFLDGPFRNDIYKKAPGHWKVNYVKDHIEKLGQGGYRRPLTMGNQLSETQAEFNARSGIKDDYEFDPRPQPFVLKNHHIDGPSKRIIPSTENEKLKGRPFFVRDQGILTELDPYLSTTHKDHRSFKKDELKKYPKKNIATYWDCEEYPKAWGFGNKQNLIPKHTVPREPLPMIDPMLFKTRTKIPRLPNSFVPVPHSGLKSEQSDRFQRPSDVKMKQIDFCPVDTPWVLPAPGPSSAYKAPQMYKTEYMNVGGREPVTV